MFYHSKVEEVKIDVFYIVTRIFMELSIITIVKTELLLRLKTFKFLITGWYFLLKLNTEDLHLQFQSEAS